MVRDFLSVTTSGIGVEQLFNSAWDICYFCWGQLDENTIFVLMLQLMTDCFIIKEEFCQQRKEGEEGIIIDDDNNKEEAEAEELFQYISNISDGGEGDESDDESDDDYTGQDVDNI